MSHFQAGSERPSFAMDYARGPGVARYPFLHDGLAALYDPRATKPNGMNGKSGGTLLDLAGKKHGVITGATWDPTGVLTMETADHVQVPNSDLLTFGDGATDRPFTIACRAFRNATNAIGALVAKYQENEKEFIFAIHNSDAIFAFVYDEVNTGYRGRSGSIAGLMPVGELASLVWTYDGSGTAGGTKIHVNGTRVDTTNFESGSYTAMSSVASSVGIGRTGTADWIGLAGGVDSVAIYSRVLTPSEIQLIYTRGLAGSNAILERKSRVFPVATAAPGGLSIPVAMHHYTKNITAA